MAMGLMPGEDDWMARLRMAGMGGIFGRPSAPMPPTAPAAPTGVLGKLNQATQPFGGPLQLGLAMLANSGPSATKRGFGEILGTSALQAQQGQQGRQDDELRRRYMEAQIGALGRPQQRKPIAVMGPDGKPTYVDEQDAIGKTPMGQSGGAPSSVQEYEYAKAQGFKGSFQDWQSRTHMAPASIQEMQAFQNMSPEQQKQFLMLKRAFNPYIQTEVAGAPGAFNKQTGEFAPLVSAQQEAAGQAMLAGAKAGAAETATKTAGATFDLPRLEQNIQQSISVIDKLKSHPGLPYITGLSSKIPIVPGTSQAGADALAKQVQGQTFLQAYNTLKGGGQITEVEGAKAEAAIARLQRSQSTKEYTSALDDLKSVLNAGLERARKQAGTSVTPKKRYNPATGKIE